MSQSVKGSKRYQAKVFLKEAVLLLPRLVRLLYRLMRDARVSKADKILIAALLAYLASPIDLIPDFVPFLGEVDDLFAVSLVILRLMGHCGEEVIREHWSGGEDIVPWIRKVAHFGKVFLPHSVIRSISDRFG